MEPVQNLKYPDVQFNFKKLLVVSLFVVSLMLFWTWISSPMLVAITGTGEASVPAEEATVSFNLSGSDPLPAAAISQVNQKVNSITQILTGTGIAEEDIFISQPQVVPASAVTPGATGFQAIVSMAVKTVHVLSLSDLISNLYSNGATLVSQPVLSSVEKSKLEDEAVNAALKDAKSQATKFGLKNWKVIKKIVAVEQATSASTSTITSKADILTQNQNTVAAQNGVFKITKAVSVTYKMW